jgi:predicted ribosome quality control (RQC) complex YloA/Tae2 family protein
VTKPEHLPLRGLERDLEAAARHLPPALRAELVAAAPPVAPQRDEAGEVIHRPAPPRAKRPEVPARLQPRRLRTSEGWAVLIGRSNEGNDHLTLHLARPEDYWFHVHGAAGSHVVLRRGKGKNEPSKRTLEEVAAWTAFYSQARTAGRVPVIWTLKKYVRKPRGAKPGTVICEREKSLMVRPGEPPKTALAGDEPTPDDHA